MDNAVDPTFTALPYRMLPAPPSAGPASSA